MVPETTQRTAEVGEEKSYLLFSFLVPIPTAVTTFSIALLCHSLGLSSIPSVLVSLGGMFTVFYGVARLCARLFRADWKSFRGFYFLGLLLSIPLLVIVLFMIILINYSYGKH